jgi:carboxyl-terminal processing protease
MEQYLRRDNLLEKFAQFGEKHQLRRRNLMLQKSRRLFERNIYGNIIYNVGEMKDYLMFLGKDDPVVIKAREILDKGQSFPTPPVDET